LELDGSVVSSDNPNPNPNHNPNPNPNPNPNHNLSLILTINLTLAIKPPAFRDKVILFSSSANRDPNGMPMILADFRLFHSLNPKVFFSIGLMAVPLKLSLI
jgi:hypothetical protein